MHWLCVLRNLLSTKYHVAHFHIFYLCNPLITSIQIFVFAPNLYFSTIQITISFSGLVQLHPLETLVVTVEYFQAKVHQQVQ